ncbi:MAG: glycosyltransferase [Lachnospiraceae bacterium]|nr:glycosyltransferase [Lachnospiraceae bacterium]
MKPFFSILIPVYNQVGKMDECIASLNAQQFEDYEVIFVNDGSTDESGKMLEGFVKEDQRRRVLTHEKNRSLLAARYTGMHDAKGEYILFLDSDDYLADDALLRIKEELDKNPVDILRFGYINEPEGSTVPAPMSENPLKDLFNGDIAPSVWKNCYNRKVIESLLEKTEPFYCNMAEDACISGMLFSIAGSFGRLDKNLYHYNTGGMSSGNVSLSLEKLKRDMASVLEAGGHVAAFVEKYRPDYEKNVKVSADRMIEFVIFQHVIFEESWDKVFEYLEYVKEGDDGKYSRFFDMACNKLIPVRVKMHLGIKLTAEDRINIFDRLD